MNAKRKVVIGVAAGLLLVGAGGAFAAGRLSLPKEERQAVINDAAKQLGIEPAKLSAALTKALQNRVDAAVADGRLTKAQGDALKARIAAGDTPLLFGGGPHRGGPGFGGGPGSAITMATASTQRRSTSASPRRNCAPQLQNGKTPRRRREGAGQDGRRSRRRPRRRRADEARRSRQGRAARRRPRRTRCSRI